jgi:hypothetical protein
MAQKKMGRPKSENPLKDRIFVLVSKETQQQLKECMNILGTTKSDVVRKGIKRIYDDLKK